MSFYADLHVHSKYARATSRNADLVELACWARRKGITVLGTGDFTHPAWFAELGRALAASDLPDRRMPEQLVHTFIRRKATGVYLLPGCVVVTS